MLERWARRVVSLRNRGYWIRCIQQFPIHYWWSFRPSLLKVRVAVIEVGSINNQPYSLIITFQPPLRRDRPSTQQSFWDPWIPQISTDRNSSHDTHTLKNDYASSKRVDRTVAPTETALPWYGFSCWSKEEGNVVQIYIVYSTWLFNLDEWRKNSPVDAGHLRNGVLLRVSTLLLVPS